MNKQRLNYLFQLYFDKTISETERNELFHYLRTASDDEISSLMKIVYDQYGDEGLSLLPDKRNEILSTIFSSPATSKQPKKKPIKHSHFFKRYIPIAAILLIGISIGLFLYQSHFAGTNDSDTMAQQVIEPGGNKAVLVLGNGRTIDLENVSMGKIADEKGVSVSKTDEGQVIYELPELNSGRDLAIAYHTIKTPRGGQYQITLPDGSKVWLNAESSLTYPTAFATERRVKLQGEAYFEIKKDKNSPFIVSTDQQNVRVLGTKFNINSYHDNEVVRTTLLEGSVQVTNAENIDRSFSTILKPGEESQLNQLNQIKIREVDPTKAIAWKNGLFRFENTDIKDVMREFSRWYNVDVKFEGPTPDIKLWGKVYRDVSASEALEILTYFNLHFRIVNNGAEKSITIYEK